MIISLEFVLITLALFSLGAILGSFLNVVIYRSIAGETWITGRSRCDDCRTLIRWFDNIPLLSFLLLRGKCRSCKKSISLTHPVVELLTGSLFVWWYWFGSFFFKLSQEPFHYLQPLFWLVVGLILIAIVVADFLFYVIPDEMVGLLMVLTLGYQVSLVLFDQMKLFDLIGSLIASLIAGLFFLLLWLITKGKGMGLGDVKLIIPLILLVGWNLSYLAIFIAFLVGAGVGLLMILLKKRKLKQAIPFGPFLIIGTITALIYGETLIQWYWSLLM
jgi:leader peptidase (prepilin peptidase) / N-methyltransferase